MKVTTKSSRAFDFNRPCIQFRRSTRFCDGKNPFYRIYYSDASWTVKVGSRLQNCDSFQVEGIVTPYFDEIVYEDIQCDKKQSGAAVFRCLACQIDNFVVGRVW